MKDKSFYAEILTKALSQGWIDKTMKILVVCGGELDKTTFQELGFVNVTISNLDTRLTGNEFFPYDWNFQDAENLDYPDEQFDFVVVHDGLHHCSSPHKALLEMYRVSRKGCLVFEARDSFGIAIAKFFKLTMDYEVPAVIYNNFKFGGLRNTQIPNYIYRWTEKEVEKTIYSYAPQSNHKIRFFYGIEIPYERLKKLIFLTEHKSLLFLIKVFLETVANILRIIFPKQCNKFAFAIVKPNFPEDLYPWLMIENDKIIVNQNWAKKYYEY